MSNGKEVKYTNLVTSIPLNQLLKLINIPYEFSNIKLTASSQNVVHIGTSQVVEKLAKTAWIYVPDPSTNVYRIGNYSYASELMSGVTKGMSVYIELSSKSNDPINDSIEYLKNNFNLDETKIEVVTFNTLTPAYAHFKKGEENKLSQILKFLKENSIHSIGRYGRWDYVSMEDCIIEGQNLAYSLSG